jgi:hypothetical protein
VKRAPGPNALVLTGLARDFTRAYPQIKKFIIDPLRIKPENIFISTWDDIGYWYPGDALKQKSFMESGSLTVDKLRTVYPLAKIKIENFDSMKPILEARLAPIPEFFRPDIQHSNYLVRGLNLVSLFYKISSGLQMIQEGTFGRIVRTRLDFAPMSYIPRVFTNSFITLKQRNHLGQGTGDNFHMGTMSEQLCMAKIFNNLEAIFKFSGNLLCPHLFVQSALALEKIKYRETSMRYTTLHTPGGQYQALGPNGHWVEAHLSDYKRSISPFKGK